MQAKLGPTGHFLKRGHKNLIVRSVHMAELLRFEGPLPPYSIKVTYNFLLVSKTGRDRYLVYG
jgi:hypothetical protein